MVKDVLTVECSISASIKDVWTAITDNHEMRKWYFNIPEFDPVPGYEFNFTSGSEKKDYVHFCEVTEVIPEKKLAYTWKYKDYPGNSLVTFELYAEGAQTRIKLTHEGLDTFPAEPDFSRESFKNGWNEILCSNLKNFVEKSK